MYRKPYAAFGRVLYANYYSQDDTWTAETRSDSDTALFFTRGEVVLRDKAGGSVLDVCKTGRFFEGRSAYTNTIFHCTATKPSVTWCYDPLVNHGFIPQIEVFKMKKGESTVLQNKTNLFLCEGEIEINDRIFASPYQLAIRSDSSTLRASTDVYGLIFK